jgi:hypothetical protein
MPRWVGAPPKPRYLNAYARHALVAFAAAAVAITGTYFVAEAIDPTTNTGGRYVCLIFDQ